MADSVSVGSLPAGFPVYGGYVDGAWPNADEIAAAHPGATVVRFCTNPRNDLGDCLDIESGDATPADAPGWVTRRRASGHLGPLVYFSEASRGDVATAFINAGVDQPPAIVAAYPGAGAVLQQPGDAGHQWIDHGPYDESVVLDYLPGIDPAPSPSTPTIPSELFAMLASDPGFAVRYLYRFALCREVDGAGFTANVNWLNAGGDLNTVLTNLQDSAEGQAVIAAQRKLLGLT